MTQPAPAPRFSRTRAEIDRAPAHDGQHTTEVLHDWGFDDARVAALLESGAVKQAG
jgi:alpha-methylacyl-CoA racemase